MKIAVIGATGNVGREVLNSLSERNFPVTEVVALASPDSQGQEANFGDNTDNSRPPSFFEGRDI